MNDAERWLKAAEREDDLWRVGDPPYGSALQWIGRLQAENARLRKAADREYRLRQKVKALRKEVRRLNAWRKAFAAGEASKEGEVEALRQSLRNAVARRRRLPEMPEMPEVALKSGPIMIPPHIKPIPVELPPDRPRAS